MTRFSLVMQQQPRSGCQCRRSGRLQLIPGRAALSSWVTGCRKSGLPDFQRPERTGPAPPGLALPSHASRAPTRTQQLPRHKRLSGARQGKKEKVLCARQNRNQKSLVCSGRLASGRTARTAKTIIKFLGNRLPEVWRFCRSSGPKKGAVCATKPESEKSCFPAGQPEEQAAHTPHPLKIFPLGLLAGAKRSSAGQGEKF